MALASAPIDSLDPNAGGIVGKWRFTAMSTWVRDYIDLVEPGHIAFAIRDMGEMAFGVVTATVECAFDNALSFSRGRIARRILST